MKRKLSCLTAFCLLLLITEAPCQQLYVDEQTVKNEEDVDMRSWTAQFDQDISYCMDAYSDFMKEVFKTKVVKRGKTILVAEKTSFPELSPLRLDQRAIFLTTSGGTSVSFTFSPGYDIHFGGGGLYEDDFQKAKRLVKNYVRYHYNKYYNDQIKTVQDVIKHKQNDIESNDKKTERNNKSIADDDTGDKAKAKNEKLQKDNKAYAADSDAKEKEISALQETLLKLNESLRKVDDFK